MTNFAGVIAAADARKDTLKLMQTSNTSSLSLAELDALLLAYFGVDTPGIVIGGFNSNPSWNQLT
jgi:hypothetical protein